MFYWSLGHSIILLECGVRGGFWACSVEIPGFPSPDGFHVDIPFGFLLHEIGVCSINSSQMVGDFPGRLDELRPVVSQTHASITPKLSSGSNRENVGDYVEKWMLARHFSDYYSRKCPMEGVITSGYD